MNGFVWSTNFCVFFFCFSLSFFHFLHKQNVLTPILHNAQSSTSTLVLFDVRILNLNSPYLNDDFPFLRLKIDVWLSKRFIAVWHLNRKSFISTLCTCRNTDFSCYFLICPWHAFNAKIFHFLIFVLRDENHFTVTCKCRQKKLRFFTFIYHPYSSKLNNFTARLRDINVYEFLSACQRNKKIIFWKRFVVSAWYFKKTIFGEI